MRLTSKHIDSITYKILDTWLKQECVELQVSRDQCIQHLKNAIENELAIEDTLNDDVNKILAQYNDQFDSGQLDRNKMFSMVKKQLAKEKNIIL